MIQRIQTVYLALGAIALLSTAFVQDLWSSAAAESFQWFLPSVIGSLSASALTALVAIGLYMNRKKQLKVVVGAQTLTVAYLIALYTGFYLSGELVLRTEDGVKWDTTIVMLLPIGAYILFYLARRAIYSDIELVKSMDRLR
jgi:uncharacterized membrane protein YhdT